MHPTYRQLLRKRISKSRGDAGFTLLELLAAVIITAALAQTIAVTMNGAEQTLTRTTDQLIVTQQASRLSHLLKYDIPSSYDVVIYRDSVKSIGGGFGGTCSSVATNPDSYVRTLFDVTVRELKYQSDLLASQAASGDPGYVYQKISYEVHTGAASELERNAARSVSIWRVDCTSGAPAIDKVFTIGSAPASLVTDADAALATARTIYGTDILKCANGSGCVADQSTRSTGATWYRATLPYLGNRVGLKNLLQGSLNELKRMIDVRDEADNYAG